MRSGAVLLDLERAHDAEAADAHRLSRAGHHAVRGGANLHAHSRRARRRCDPHGDRSRIQGIKPRDQKGSSQSTYFFQHNHSKRSLALQWRHPRSTEILKALTAKVDVLVENFAPGVMARAGLGYDELRKLNCKLVMCSISVAGQVGPLSAQPGYDYIAAAYAGVTDQIGEANGSPAQFTIAIGDVSTGVTAAMAVGFALLHRERTGEGQYIDSAILDTYFHMHEVNVPRVALRGEHIVAVPIRDAVSNPKYVDPAGELVATARSLGISFGEHL